LLQSPRLQDEDILEERNDELIMFGCSTIDISRPYANRRDEIGRSNSVSQNARPDLAEVQSSYKIGLLTYNYWCGRGLLPPPDMCGYESSYAHRGKDSAGARPHLDLRFAPRYWSFQLPRDFVQNLGNRSNDFTAHPLAWSPILGLHSDQNHRTAQEPSVLGQGEEIR